MRKKDSIGIVGSGNSARALASYLASKNYNVNLLVRNIEKIKTIYQTKKITAVGKLEGTFDINLITEDPKIFADNCETIFVATVTTAYRDIAVKLSPFLQKKHKIILFSGKFGGCLEVEKCIKETAGKELNVLEIDAVFACRIKDDSTVWIRGIKNWAPYSSTTVSKTKESKDIFNEYFPGIPPAANVIQRGLSDFGAFCHPVTMIVNMNNVDKQVSFPFYYEGLTERTCKVLEELENEAKTIAGAYDTPFVPLAELLDRYYGCEKECLLKAIKSVPNYRDSISPCTLSHRYLHEDVPCSLVPLYYLAQKAKLNTPTLISIINLSSTLTGENFLATGRTLERLGLSNKSRKEIIRWINN